MKSYCSSYEIKMAMDYANALSQFVNFAPKNVITYPFPISQWTRNAHDLWMNNRKPALFQRDKRTRRSFQKEKKIWLITLCRKAGKGDPSGKHFDMEMKLISLPLWLKSRVVFPLIFHNIFKKYNQIWTLYLQEDTGCTNENYSLFGQVHKF